jgi:predicted RNase H-like HicB family nuclease
MQSFTAVIERDPGTGLLVGYVPGFPGAHSQGQTVEELVQNLREVIAMLLEDGQPKLEAEFVGIQSIQVA